MSPSLKAMRSLVNANSLSFDGSMLANIGILRRSSTSSLRLKGLLLGRALCPGLAVEEIAGLGDAGRRRQRLPAGDDDGLIAGDEAARRHRLGNERRDLHRDRAVVVRVTAAKIGMNERDAAAEAQHRARQRLRDVAEKQVLRVGHRTRMRVDMTFEHEDFARAEALAQMIVSAPVAKAQLEDGAFGHVARPRCEIDAGALRFQAPDEAVEA